MKKYIVFLLLVALLSSINAEKYTCKGEDWTPHSTPDHTCDHIIKVGFILYEEINEGIPGRDAVVTNSLKQSLHQLYGLQIFVEYVNRGNYKVNEEKICFDIVVKCNDYTEEIIKENTCDLLEEEVKIIMAPFGTGNGYLVANITENHDQSDPCNWGNSPPDDIEDILLITSSSGIYEFTHDYKNTFSTYPNMLTQMRLVMPYFRDKAKSATLLMTTGSNDRDTAITICDGIDVELEKAFIDTIDEIWYDGNPESGISGNYTKVAEAVAEIDNDLVIFCGRNTDILTSITSNFQKIDYTPKGAFSTAVEINNDPHFENFWVVSSTIIRTDFGFPDSRFIKTEAEYVKLFLDIHGEENLQLNLYQIGLFTVFGCEILLDSIITSEQFEDISLLVDTIRRGTFQTFLGDISFDNLNVNLNPGVPLQSVNGYYNIIGPHTISNSTLIYPMPKWHERVKRTSFHAVEYVAIVLLAVAIVNSLVWLVIVISRRESPTFVASSPIFLISMLIGSIFIYVSLYFWMPNNVSDTGCSIRVGGIVFGFLLLFGSMVVKTWRVHILFSQKTLEVFHISNTQVALFLCIILSIDVLLFLIWTLLTKPETGKLIVDIYNEYENIHYCRTTTGGLVMIYIMIGYHALLFIYGGYLAIRVRRIPFKIYDESKIIGFCIYNVGVVAVIVAILEGTNASSDVNVQFAIRTFLILLSTVLTINTMLIGKLASNRKSKYSSSSGSSGSQMHSTIDHSSKHIDWEGQVEKLKKQKKELKKEVKELREALDSLKGAS